MKLAGAIKKCSMNQRLPDILNRMKEWKPQREFQKADFPLHPVKGKQEAVQSTDLKPGRVVKSRTPPSVTENNASLKKVPRMSSQPIRSEAKMQPAQKTAGGSEQAGVDLSGALLDELVLARPVESTDLLRRWYWQKPAGGTTPQTKIYIILHSMKKETLVELYRCFTAMERRQMHEIFNTRRAVVKSEILSTRREFMEYLSQSFS
jgi:hypothetical protein